MRSGLTVVVDVPVTRSYTVCYIAENLPATVKNAAGFSFAEAWGFITRMSEYEPPLSISLSGAVTGRGGDTGGCNGLSYSLRELIAAGPTEQAAIVVRGSPNSSELENCRLATPFTLTSARSSIA